MDKIAIKEMLLREADTRTREISKLASMSKSAMPYWIAQDNLSGQGTLTVERSDFNWRKVADIKKKVEEIFEPYMLQRKHKKGAESFRIAPEPSSDSNDNPFTQGSNIYFRFNFKRNIFPQRGEEANVCDDILQDIALTLGSHEFEDMVDFCERNGIPILPYYAATCESSTTGRVDAVKTLLEESETQWGNNYRDRSDSYLQYVNQTLSSDPKQLHIGPIEVSVALNENQVRQTTKILPLLRLMTYKMAAGYTLNVKKLEDTLGKDYSDVVYNENNTKQYGEPSPAQIQEIALHWRKTRRTLLALYKVIHDKLKSFISDRLDATRNLLRDYHFIDMGLPVQYFGKSKNLVLTTPHTVSTRDFQTLVICVDQSPKEKNKEAIRPNFAIDQGVWVDRQRKLFVPPDGLSQNPRVSKEQDSKLLLAPIKFKGRKAFWDKDNMNLGRKHMVKRRREMGELLKRYGPFAKKAYLRLRDAVDTGQTGEELSRVFSTLSSAFTGANILANMTQQFIDMNSPHSTRANAIAFTREFINKKIARSNQNKETPLDVLDIENAGKVTEAADLDLVTGDPEKDDQSVMQDEMYKLIRQYGFYLSKMMELAYAVGHYSCREKYGRFKSIGKGNKPTGTRGHSYVHTRLKPEETEENEAVPGLEIYGVGHGSSSGIGRGGEIIICCKYAYEAQFTDSAVALREQVLATRNEWQEGKKVQPDNLQIEKIEQNIRDELQNQRRKKKERLLPKYPEGFQARKTVNAPQTLEEGMTDVSGVQGYKQGCIIKELPEYWFGMSSTYYDPEDIKHNVARATGRKLTENSWTAVMNRLLSVYPALRTEIWPLNMKMEILRRNVKDAFDECRRKLSQPGYGQGEEASGEDFDVEMIYITDEGRRDVIHQTEFSASIIGKNPDTAIQQSKIQNLSTEPEAKTQGPVKQPIQPSEQVVPSQTPAPVQTQVPRTTPNEQEQAGEPVIEEEESKPMANRDVSKRVMKKDKLKQPTNRVITKGNIDKSNVLQKIAETSNKMDEIDQYEIANKLDELAAVIKAKLC